MVVAARAAQGQAQPYNRCGLHAIGYILYAKLFGHDAALGVGTVVAMNPRWIALPAAALLAGAATAAPGDNKGVVRELAGRVGPIIGSASACRDIMQGRVQLIVDKFAAVIRENSSNEAERDDLTRLLDRFVAEGALARSRCGKRARVPVRV